MSRSSTAAFEDFRSKLSSDERTTLDRLAHQSAASISKTQTAITVESLTKTMATSIPGLTAEEAEGLALYSAYVLVGSDADKASRQSAPSDLRELAALKEQMIKLQISMQRENLVFTSVSNVLKTRHDTVKNSIANVR